MTHRKLCNSYSPISVPPISENGILQDAKSDNTRKTLIAGMNEGSMDEKSEMNFFEYVAILSGNRYSRIAGGGQWLVEKGKVTERSQNRTFRTRP